MLDEWKSLETTVNIFQRILELALIEYGERGLGVKNLLDSNFGLYFKFIKPENYIIFCGESNKLIIGCLLFFDLLSLF